MEKQKIFVKDYDKEISKNDLDNAVAEMADKLQLYSASVGGFNLFEVNRAYFLDRVKRKEINKMLGISEAFEG